jgi:hypothetical protein
MVGKPVEKRPLERSRRGLEIKIKFRLIVVAGGGS